MEKAEVANKVLVTKEDVLMLCTDPSPFITEISLSVAGEVPNSHNTAITGTFKSKVFEGTYRDIAKFIKQMNAFLSDQELEAEKYYMHYAYCPKCAKEAGHNYIVLFAEIDVNKEVISKLKTPSNE